MMLTMKVTTPPYMGIGDQNISLTLAGDIQFFVQQPKKDPIFVFSTLTVRNGLGLLVWSSGNFGHDTVLKISEQINSCVGFISQREESFGPFLSLHV